MQRGTLRVSSGIAALCEYELTGERGGRLSLPSALYLPARARDSGTLRLVGGERREVQITFSQTLGEASFSYTD